MEVSTLSKFPIEFKDMVANYLSPKPRDVEGLNNISYLYYQSQLQLKLFSIFNFENVPENWNIDYIKDNLFKAGYMVAVEKNGDTWLLGKAGYSGIDMYNYPTHIVVANPVLGNFTRKIGVDGELVYFNRVNGCFLSTEPLIKRYALLLAQCDASINVSLMNSRVAHVFTTNNKAMAQTLNKVYDDVTEGRPFVVINKGSIDFPTEVAVFNNVKNTYIANDILITKRTLMNEFLTEIGIMNANTDKRERLNSQEVNANNGETMCLCSLWLNTLNSCFERVNKLFNLNVKVSFNKEVIRQLQQEYQDNKEVVVND